MQLFTMHKTMHIQTTNKQSTVGYTSIWDYEEITKYTEGTKQTGSI